MPAMRDRKGQFRKGFDGMKPVGPKAARALKALKRPEKTLNSPLTQHGSTFGKAGVSAPDGARVNVNVGAVQRAPGNPTLRRGSAAGVIPGGAMITKTQGGVTRGDRNESLAVVKLSKGQQQRLADRDAGILKGKQAKLKARGGEERPSVQAMQASNNAKVMNAATMTPAQKIEAYQQMHGKAPSAAATAKLNRAGKSETMRDYVDKVGAPAPALKKSELDAAQKLGEKLGLLKPAGGDQQKVVKPTGNSETAGFTQPAESKARGGTSYSAADEAKARKAREAAIRKSMAPGGGDQKKVLAPSDMTHDQALAKMNDIAKRLAASTDARKARGGKTTSAEEKRLKKEFEAARDVRQAIAMKNANSRPMATPQLTDAQKADQARRDAETRAYNARPKGKAGGSRGRAVGLGDLLTDLAERKGLTASDLKPTGPDQRKVIDPRTDTRTSDQKQQLAELSNARKYLQDDKQYAQSMRNSSDREEAGMADLQVREGEKHVRALENSLKAQGLDVSEKQGAMVPNGQPAAMVATPKVDPEDARLTAQVADLFGLMQQVPKSSAAYARYANQIDAIQAKQRRFRK